MNRACHLVTAFDHDPGAWLPLVTPARPGESGWLDRVNAIRVFLPGYVFAAVLAAVALPVRLRVPAIRATAKEHVFHVPRPSSMLSDERHESPTAPGKQAGVFTAS